MEEIITVDGKQFKLSTDRPLTAQEKAHTIGEIRKQTGCGTCGSKVAKAGNDWQYGGGRVQTLPFDTGVIGTGTSGKKSTDSVTLTASPTGGVRPYTVRFWKSLDGTTIIQVGTGGVGGTHTTLPGDPEGTAVTDSYTLTDDDVAGALGNATAKAPSAVDDTTGVITLNGATTLLAVGSIRFYTSVVDSCPGADKGKCAQYADVTLACIAPTCGFVVT